MPLHAHDGLELTALYGLYDTVGRLCRHSEACAWVGHGLMMEGVYEDFFCVIKRIQNAVWLQAHAVGGLGAVGILRMLDEREQCLSHLYLAALALSCRFLQPDLPALALFSNILAHPSAQRHGQRLYAPANAQHRYLPVEGQLRDQHLRQVAVGVDAMQLLRRLFAAPQRVVVRPSGEQQSVEMFQCVHDDIGVCNGRNEHGRASGCHYLLVIFIAQRSISVGIICCKPYHRAVLRLRILVISTCEVRAKRVFHRQSSVFTGISRLMLCSREMSVSVLTTPGMVCIWLLSKSMSCSLSLA